MQTRHKTWLTTIAASIVLSTTWMPGIAQTTTEDAQNAPEKDPARWYIEDTTNQERYRTATKEAHAAYQDALKECKKVERSERTSCKKEANAQLRADLAEAKRILQG
jgi:hypothetical protein